MAESHVMHTFESIRSLREQLSVYRKRGLKVALVPTMGALHAGHLALVDLARTFADIVVVSIFVNPKQFGPNEDLGRYPRTLAQDKSLLETHKTDVLFAPAVDEIYPDAFETMVSVGRVSQGLCGALRPGHFDGVATIVLKLLHICRPDLAVFGEKDFQQLAVIRAMVRDLSFETEIIGAPIVREPDGLAMSSRNVYLSPVERSQATGIYAGLTMAQRRFKEGETDAERLLSVARAEMNSRMITPQYLELRAFDGLEPLVQADRPCVMLAAAIVGSTRLIDNLILARP